MESEGKPNNSNRIARCCLEHFQTLPKTGKPTSNEWTVLSAILVHNSIDDNFSVISLGTGTKCMPKNSLDSTGYLVNDSHAEVLARRGLLRFLLSEMCKAHDSESNILSYSAAKRKFQLSPNISFHFFSTHSPCGDGSIFNHTEADFIKRFKIAIDADNVGDILTSTVNFTGGKLLTSNQPDLMAQDIAAIRTKPGRGERTASVSCSDKLARWNCVGLQGALLHTILEPVIYFSSLTFCGTNNVAAIERIWTRWSNTDSLPNPFSMQTPTVQLTDNNIRFEFEKRDDSQPPSPASIVWCKVSERKLEVIVHGRRQGITKKKWNTSAGQLFISKRGLLEKYLDIVQVKYPEIGIELGIGAGISYKLAKNASTAYTKAWTHTKRCIFKQWTIKPDNLNDFVLDRINKKN